MVSNKFLWVLLLCVALMTVLACGQVSLGVITPTAVNVAVETQAVNSLISTSDLTTPTHDPSTATAVDPTETPVPERSIPNMAYIGLDGNLWMLEAGNELPRQLTFDANPMGGEDPAVEYGTPRLSSDGTLLAYRLDVNEFRGNFAPQLIVEHLEWMS